MTSIALVLAAAVLAGSETPNGPAVRVAQPPVYPEAAIKARMEGQAVVDVTIDEEGCVVATEARGTNPLIAGSGRRAAAAWEFAAEPGVGERCATLVFDFVLNEPGVGELHPEIESTSPFSLTVAGLVQPRESVAIHCYFPVVYSGSGFVESNPWGTRFYEGILKILPLR